MTSFLQLAASLREQMNATLSRSDVLKPLAWLVGLLLTGLIMAVATKADQWVIGTLVGAIALAIATYIGAYVFCLFVDRDALRSERYSLQKMAIEQRLIGDSSSGLFEPEDASTSPLAIGSASVVESKP